ncbi:DUF6671 family protein [Thalassorhabdus alkalitolerans]|uniref:DUF6671 family protein n=2 Tax=Bacillaceae TaxID=186817 RepID=A0ABW0YUW4_9BACI
MNEDVKKLFLNRKCVIATMHKKEEVIAPILEHELALEAVVPESFDSDSFGTFTKEVKRAGNQLEAARKKAMAAMKQTGLDIGIASEGSFGAHPVFSHVPYNRELIVCIDQKQGFEIIGYAANSNTNAAQKEIASFKEAEEFAKSAGFPEHGLIVKRSNDSRKSKDIIKGITSTEELNRAVESLSRPANTSFGFWKKTSKLLSIETDMRAMYNPTRMKNIELAAQDLVSKITSLCPSCSAPGFEVTEHKKGLPCAGCGFPTEALLAHVYSCKKCSCKHEVQCPKGKEYEDPLRCHVCNP